MNRTTRLALVVALPLVCMSFAWGQEAPSSAPWLGDEEYSIEFEGTLEGAMNALGELTGRRFMVRPGPRAPGAPPPPPVDMNQPITLQFEQARLDQLVLALCEQAGLVYDGRGLVGNIVLRRGDPQADPRPVEVVDQYVMRVSRVMIGLNTALDLRWGEPLPEESAMTDHLTVTIEVDFRTPELFARLGSIDPAVTATTDTGLALERSAQMPGGRDLLPFTEARSGFGATGFAVRLPAPPEGPRMLTTLEGKLKLHSEARMTDVRIEPHSAGKTFTEDDVTVTVREWRQADQFLTVNVEQRHPLPPRDPGQRARQFHDLQWAVAVGADGSEASSLQPIRPMSPGEDGAYRLNFMFFARDVDHVRLTVARRDPPDLEVPFVIRDIPLP